MDQQAMGISRAVCQDTLFFFGGREGEDSNVNHGSSHQRRGERDFGCWYTSDGLSGNVEERSDGTCGEEG